MGSTYMKPNSPEQKDIPLKIVGSNQFGRYPKISLEQTFNMIISDNWLVPYAGYQNVLSISLRGRGRGIYASSRANKMIVVINNNVYAVITESSYNPVGMPNITLIYTRVGTIKSFSGDVFIDENNTNQIAICDKQHLYIYNYITGQFVQAQLPPGVTPGYVTYQDGYFIISNINNNTWILSAPGDGTNWNLTNPVIGAIQTKPDLAMAVLRVPGRGNLLFVFGKTVTELWTDVGAQIFPYQRNSAINIDYGVANQATIATSDNYVAWVGINEKSGPVIMFSRGGDVEHISNDGIDFKLAQIANPSASSAFFFKQDGHLFYQVTFYDSRDNLTLTCDFSNKFKFYTMTDQYMNYHIAQRVAFFNNQYFFVSFSDGNLYELSSLLTTYDYGDRVCEIPRVRVCPTFSLKDRSRFVVNNINFPVEQGQDPASQGLLSPNYHPRIDLTVSKDGGQTFSNGVSKILNRVGIRRNRVNFWGQGAANEFIPQFRFWGQSRFVVGDGLMSVYQ